MSAQNVAYSDYDRLRGRSQYSNSSYSHSQQGLSFPQRPHLPTPPIDDPRARTSSPFAAAPYPQTNYRLPQPPQLADDMRRQSLMGSAYDHFGMDSTAMNTPLDSRRGSDQQQSFVMVPAYHLPMYADSSSNQFDGWQQSGNQNLSAMQFPSPYGNFYAMPPAYGLVQRPLPPAPAGPVEKPKRRRAPPAPQYLHMTVQEMIEELAYRKIDTSQMQARKAKKAEYIDQLQKADRDNNLGRGAWKTCHGDVPPISARKDMNG
jgi:hypothetical protein